MRRSEGGADPTIRGPVRGGPAPVRRRIRRRSSHEGVARRAKGDFKIAEGLSRQCDNDGLRPAVPGLDQLARGSKEPEGSG